MTNDKFKRPFREKKKKSFSSPHKKTTDPGLTRLNKYIANAGICSRREADELIANGLISVNGKVVTEMGFKIKEGDVVKYGGHALNTEKKQYVILNKPKDYITTTDDPGGRKNVMELIAGACRERIYPVGSIERNTKGVLLITNDGELAKKLTHPKHKVPKYYQVVADKSITRADLEAMMKGIKLEDGFIAVDSAEFIRGSESKKEVAIEIHSGKNRIVRRIFEHLGYKVMKLDRIGFAGLTKKDIPRGTWRHLTEKEVAFLKML